MQYSRAIDVNLTRRDFHFYMLDNIPEFLGFSTKGNYYTFHFSLSVDESVINSFIDTYISEYRAEQGIKSFYRENTEAGQEYFEKVRANLSLLISKGGATLNDAYFIESKLEVVKNMVITGDWASAQNEITNNVTPEGSFTQEMYDSIKNYIDNYVLENY